MRSRKRRGGSNEVYRESGGEFALRTAALRRHGGTGKAAIFEWLPDIKRLPDRILNRIVVSQHMSPYSVGLSALLKMILMLRPVLQLQIWIRSYPIPVIAVLAIFSFYITKFMKFSKNVIWQQYGVRLDSARFENSNPA